MSGYAQGDKSKVAIVRTALELWREGGERAVTARAVGKRVGLSHAGVIYHFGSTGAMLDAVKRQAIEDGDGVVIAALILGNDPLVAEWDQPTRQAWLVAGAG